MSKAQRMSEAAVARELGCSRRTVARLGLERGPGGVSLADARKALRSRRAKREAEGAAASADGAALRAQKLELVKWQARWRESTAKLSAIELEHAQGKYVELAVVKADIGDCMDRLQAILRSIPQRTCSAVENALHGKPELRAAVIEHLIADEIERAIGTIAEGSTFVRPVEGSILTVTCGMCAVREQEKAEETADRAQIEALGRKPWQDVLRAALDHCIAERPRAGDEVDEKLLPLELRGGLGSASLFLRSVALVADQERSDRRRKRAQEELNK